MTKSCSKFFLLCLVVAFTALAGLTPTAKAQGCSGTAPLPTACYSSPYNSAPYSVPNGCPTSSVTANQDQAALMCQLGLQFPTPASNPPVSTLLENDPYAPVNAFPVSPTSPEGNWTDVQNFVVVRWQWGLWTTYEQQQSGGKANVLCGGAAGCTETQEYGTSTGGASDGYGDYGPEDQTSGGYPVIGARPYPTGSALLGYPDDTVPCTAPGCLATGYYAPIDLFTTKATNQPVLTAKDWWLTRRPEILDLVQKEIYGYMIPQSKWPAITWTIGNVTTGTQAGMISCITPTTGTTCATGTVADGHTYAYRQKTYTATISTANYPAGAPPLRNKPTLSVTCRFPSNATGKVPMFIGNSETDTDFEYTAPAGYGACGYTQTTLQADAGGSSATSYLSGLIDGGNWRTPTEAGTLQIWAWGLSRLIDEFANDPDPIGPNADKVAVAGVSRDGKLSLVEAAMDDRIVATLPSDAGEGGTAFLRKNWGESIESIAGNSEYYWMAGNLMSYAGPECSQNPNHGPAGCTPAYKPRAVAELDVDSPEVEALVAPRVMLTNGGLTGDSWEDTRAMYMSGAIASPVWTLLGWPGMIIPSGTVFTSNPTNYGTSYEGIGGTPPANVAFISGTVGYRRHSQGHTDVPEWPVFVTFASKYMSDVRPVITPGQTFTLASQSVGPVTGTPGGGGALGNWQIKGGTGAWPFSIDPNTGIISLTDTSTLTPGQGSYTLLLMASDGILPSHDETVTINVPHLLTNLVPSVGTLNPAFNPSTTNYTINLQSNVTSITLTPTVAGSSETITVNGASAASGVPSAPIALQVGVNNIAVAVTAVDGATQVYNVAVSVVQPPTVTLTATAAVSGSHGSGYTMTITVKNTGTGPASNVTLTAASLGTTSGTPLPQTWGTIAAGGTGTFTVSVPGSAGLDGAGVAEKFSGAYTGGTYSASIRSVTLP